MPISVVAPERGTEFPPGPLRLIGKLISLLGWLQPASWFLAPFRSTHFRVEQPIIEVPRAVNAANPTDVRITFRAERNITLMLKTIEVDSVNRTAAVFGEVIPFDIVSGRQRIEGRLASLLGLPRRRGRFVKPQSQIKADEGGFGLIFRNNDPFSVARFCLEVEGWVVA